MSATLQVGDVGTIIEVTLLDGETPVSVVGATSKTMRFQKPGGTVIDKAAAFTTDGSDGKVQYVTVSGDLDIAGVWQVQAKIVTAEGQWTSAIGTFKVAANLPAPT